MKPNPVLLGMFSNGSSKDKATFYTVPVVGSATACELELYSNNGHGSLSLYKCPHLDTHKIDTWIENTSETIDHT